MADGSVSSTGLPPTSPDVGGGPPQDGDLRRQVGFIGLLWASEGSLIGSGWLLGSFAAATVAGTAALLSWGIGIVAITLLALVHAELGGMFPVAGGTARYPWYSYGRLAGFSFGWFSWVQAVAVAPIEVEAALTYASVHLPWLQHADKTLTGWGYLAATLLMALFVAVNLLGVGRMAAVNNAATWWKVGVPLLTILVLGVVAFHGPNFGGHGGFAPFGAHGVLAAVSGGGVIFALLGFEQAVQLGGESRNPSRDIPRAVLGSLLVGATIFLLLQAVFIAALPDGALAQGWGRLHFPGDAGPFAGLAAAAGLGWLATVLYIDAVISPAATGLIYVTVASRVSYGLARSRVVPTVFARTTRGRGAPWFGLAVAFATGMFLLLPFPSWQKMVSFVTSASVLMYAGAPLALAALRRQVPERARPFRMPWASVLSPASFVVANLIIYWSGWPTLWRLGVAVAVGFALFAVVQVLSRRRGDSGQLLVRADWRAAQWLVPYLAGMGALSWLGSFGGSGRLPLWWDMLAVAAFSLVVYVWALAVRLPAAEVAAAIGAEESPVPVVVAAGEVGDLPTAPEPA